MKKTLLIVLLGSLALTTGYAMSDSGMGSGNCDGGRSGHRMMHNMADELNLTDDQKTQVKEIFQEQHKKVREIMEEQRKIVKPKMDALHEDTRDKLSKVLNADQMKQFDEKVAEMKERRQHMHDRMKDRRNSPDDSSDSTSGDSSDSSKTE